MRTTPSTLVVALSVLLPSFSYAALPEMNQLKSTYQELSKEAEDSHYKRVEKEARNALSQLETLRNDAKSVSQHSENLKEEMLDRHYDDMVDTQLRAFIHDAAALKESIENIYNLEKDNVKRDLKKAKSGDFTSIDATLPRINKFREEGGPKLDTVRTQIKGVEDAYKHDYDNARAALAQLLRQDPLPTLFAAKRLKKVELEVQSLRPLHWKLIVEKKERKDDDEIFKRIPSAVSILDGQQQVSYPVFVR